MEFRGQVLEAKRRRRSKALGARPRSIWANNAARMLGSLATLFLIGVGSLPTPETVDGLALIHDARSRVAHAPVAGAVTRVLVRPGDTVERGAALVQLRDPVVEIEHAAAQRRLERGLVARLRARGSSTEGSPVRPLVDELTHTRAQLDLHTLRAEAAGIVTGIQVEAGDEVEARDALLTLREPGPSELIARVDIPAHASEKVELGAKVLISFGEGHGAKRNFEVIAISTQAQPADPGDEAASAPTSRFWARYIEDPQLDPRRAHAHPQPGMEGRAELVYRERSLFAALADILVGVETS